MLKHALKIKWHAGDEFVPIDLANLRDSDEFIRTWQTFENGTYHYLATMRTGTADNGACEVTLRYDPEDNKHIPQEDSYWGITRLTFSPDKAGGTAFWNDNDQPKQRNGSAPFEVVQIDDDGNGLAAPYEGIEDIGATDKRTLAKVRVAQHQFRANVLRNEKFCRVTGIADPAHLRASHIVGWAECKIAADKVNGCNGLMLAPHIDHLFDRGYISFSDQGELLVSSRLNAAVLQSWGIDPQRPKVPPVKFNEIQRAFLHQHRATHGFADS